MDDTGLVFDIQGFSVHDGPGCRTLIFLKGCPLRCFWCSNPEGLSPVPELLYYRNRCVHDRACVHACPHNAITTVAGDSFVHFDKTKCIDCTDHPCEQACTQRAIRFSGAYFSVDGLLHRIQRDRPYWGSGGGITLSGGEPMMQFEFTRRLLKSCQDAYIHTAIETCGMAPRNHYESILDFTDWIFFDLKHMDSERHREATGVGNEQILENATYLASQNRIRLVFRMPLISGFNDSEEHIHDVAHFIKAHGNREINLLPLHHLGASKYGLTGRSYHYHDAQPPDAEAMRRICALFESCGVACYIGSGTPF